MNAFLEDDRRVVKSSLVRIAAGNPGSQAWAEWRRLAGVPASAHNLTRLEAVLLVARGNWQAVKKFHGITSRIGPSYTELYKLGTAWFSACCTANTKEGIAVFGGDGVEGRSLAEVIRILTGKTRSENTIRSRCCQFGWGFRASQIYKWDQVMTIAESL